MNAGEKTLWDLGVIIDYDRQPVIQKEIDIKTLDNIYDKELTHKHIKALYSNSFIEPILHEIKNPINNDLNIFKKYDNILEHLSIQDKINMIKKSFLNKEYWKFFSLHSFLKNDENSKDTTLNSMYIQNLYYSKKTDEGLKFINTINENDLSDIMLLYKIKIQIKSKNIEDAKQSINLFMKKYSDSDFTYYVEYEKKLIEIKYAN
jgi:hypothetical protein